MDNKGYIYTIVTLILVLLLFSLVSVFFQTAEKSVDESLDRVSMDFLGGDIDDIKKDYESALKNSGIRATLYAINYLIDGEISPPSKNFSNYVMTPCSGGFIYPINGSQSAIAELILCGTLLGSPVTGMKNNSLVDWKVKTENAYAGKIKIQTLNIKNITIFMKDPWEISIISILEIIAKDNKGSASFNSSIPVYTSFSIIGFDDPLYFMMTNETDLIRQFVMCNKTSDYGEINGTIINEWINKTCYHDSNMSFKGPSFFDRLEGNMNISEKYVNQSKKYFSNDDIGLESFLNLYEFWIHNITDYKGDRNSTWIDYLYWRGVLGNCSVNYTESYRINDTHNITFWIDGLHREKYQINREVSCYGW